LTGYRFGCITFLSDYGLSDEFVGVCHGVIRNIAPDVEIIDVTHGIRAQNVREGAMVLAQALPYMPAGVHLAIVDPGVGSGRLPIVVTTQGGSLLVGPDNGLLTLAAKALGGATSAHKIENPSVTLPEISRTFQGRDIFAPAAAHLALGVPAADVGPELALDSLVSLTIPEPRRHDDHFHAEVLHVDRFGNLQLNVSPAALADLGLGLGSMLEVRVEGHRSMVPYAETFASVPPGETLVAEDSYRLLAIAVNRGSAALLFNATIGSSVIIGSPGSGAGD
jgi:hypothetical protein